MVDTPMKFKISRVSEWGEDKSPYVDHTNGAVREMSIAKWKDKEGLHHSREEFIWTIKFYSLVQFIYFVETVCKAEVWEVAVRSTEYEGCKGEIILVDDYR